MSNDRIAVYLSKEMYEKVRKKVELSRGEFKTVDEYVGFVLQELLKEESNEDNSAYTSDEEKEIEKRFKALGYI